MPRRGDNLFRLHGRISGQQLAGWEPSAVADSGLGCRLVSDVMIPVAEGVRLSADIYFPRKAGRYPAIVQMAGYSRDLHSAGVPRGTNEIGSPPIITGRGYIQVVLTRRGMGRSEGSSGMFMEEQEIIDYCTAIEWVATQVWCSGDVVMFGTSYYAMIQPQVAARKPKGLRAFFAHEFCTDYFRHLSHYSGSPNHDFFALWMGANFKQSDFDLYVPPAKRALMSWFINRRWFWEKVAHRKVDTMFAHLADKEPSRQALEWFADIVFRRKARGQGGLSLGSYPVIKDIDIPFVAVQNTAQWNIHQFGSYDLFDHAATPADTRYLILSKPEYELPVLSWQLEALAFFDYIVKKIDNGYDKVAPVRYWIEGSDSFGRAGDFPVPEAKRTRLHLRAGSLGESIPEGGKESWIGIPRGTHKVAGVDKVITQTLRFEYRFDTAKLMAGPISLSLNFSCNEIDTYVVARLGRLDVTGNFHRLAMGALSPARRRLDPSLGSRSEIAIDYASPEALVPGRPVLLKFSLTPAASRFETGDKLVLEIASRTDLLKAEVSEGFVHLNFEVPPYFCENTVHYGQETFLEVDLIGV